MHNLFRVNVRLYIYCTIFTVQCEMARNLSFNVQDVRPHTDYPDLSDVMVVTSFRNLLNSKWWLLSSVLARVSKIRKTVANWNN